MPEALANINVKPTDRSTWLSELEGANTFIPYSYVTIGCCCAIMIGCPFSIRMLSKNVSNAKRMRDLGLQTLNANVLTGNMKAGLVRSMGVIGTNDQRQVAWIYWYVIPLTPKGASKVVPYKEFELQNGQHVAVYQYSVRRSLLQLLLL